MTMILAFPTEVTCVRNVDGWGTTVVQVEGIRHFWIIRLFGA